MSDTWKQTILVAHPSPELYGSDRVVLESVAGLSARDFHVVLSLPKPGPLVPAIEQVGANVEIMSMPVLRKSLLRPRNFAGFIGDSVRGLFQGFLLLGRYKPTVVVVNTATIPLWILAARLRRIPVLLHIHESERQAHRILRLALALPATLCRSVVVNSEYSTNSLTQVAPWLKGKTTVIYNGVPGPGSPSPPRAILNDPVRVLFVGRLSERKGAHIVIQALKLLQERGMDIQVELLGAVFEGYEWFEQELHKQVASLPDPSKVQFLGFASHVWPHYEACDIALVPSTMDEPFGNTAVEALLARRPVLVSDIGGLPEAVRGLDGALLVVPNDAQALANGITEIIEHWEEYRHKADLGHNEAAMRFDPTRYRKAFADQVQLVRSRKKGFRGILKSAAREQTSRTSPPDTVD